MPGCKPRHPILSTLHIDSASADTPSDDDVLTWEADDGLWHPKAITPGIKSHPLLSDRDQKDHSRYGALEDASTWAALQTFGAGLKLAVSQTIQDSGGTGRILLATASPHITLTGGTRLAGNVSIDSLPDTDVQLLISGSYTGVDYIWGGLRASPTVTTTGNTRSASCIGGQLSFKGSDASVGHSVFGLSFVAALQAISTDISATKVRGCSASGGVYGIYGNAHCDDAYCFYTTFDNLYALGGFVTIDRLHGFYLEPKDLSDAGISVTDAFGLYLGDITGTSFTNKILIHAGPATPYLKLVGGAAPGVFSTNLYLNENGNLRHVQWKAGDTLGSGDKVMVLV